MLLFLARHCTLVKRFLLTACVLSTALLFLMSGVLMAQQKKPAADVKIVVIGGGMAGMAAALEASGRGVRVALVEGQKFPGGNSAKATSGINGCRTQAQMAAGIQDSQDLFFDDTVKAGHNENDLSLVDVMVHNAADAISFLNSTGLDLTAINIGGGHSVPRTHTFPVLPDEKLRPFGVTVVRTVFGKLQERKISFEAQNLVDRLEILMETRVESLIVAADDQRRVVGVRVKSSRDPSVPPTEIYADAVILASGGFCSDHDPDTSLLVKYAGDKIHYPTTNGPFADGSGMKMAQRVGAQLIDMQKIQIHPTGFIDPVDPKSGTKFLAAEALRGAGALLLNEKGERFANELGLRDYLTGEILAHCQLNESTGTHTAHLVLNQRAVDKFGRPAFDFYWKTKKFFKVAENSDQLAEMTGVDPTTLRKTFENYNDAKNSKKTDFFGKKVFPTDFDTREKLYVGTITPVLHYSMGGVKINADAQVLHKDDDRPIRGLYAAGEVAGGLHGGNRLSGNSYLDCVVFGRIAGAKAAEQSA